MATGSCLCGSVHWTAQAPLGEMTHCHCSMCRKAHGAPFATYFGVSAERFAWTAGEQNITRYRASPAFERAFCGECGSVLPGTDADGVVYAPAGCLDDDPGIRPTAHIYVASKAPWHRIADALAQYPTSSVAEDAPDYALDRQGAGRAGVLRGSCLCGAAVYEVTGEIVSVHNCHCSRCRKARAAAHTTNGFTPADELHYLSGESLLRQYKVPDAVYFTHTFCSVCGSGMPRPNAPTPYVAIPFGTLDDDPGRGADDHIYTAYKAAWYGFADTLPTFPEGPPG